ncbi:MAG: nucleoside triphosphate pyrophosphohydrolase [Geminicoccaceae bacterium]|nr:nucleoside triphosphate pyrophosphohydrolase [Geminicoccaceae bacterium]
MRRLRNPEGGCPWDIEQTFDTIAPYTIEEAYEVADAIGRGDFADLREELGDLLLQTVYHAQMADEAGLFSFDDVAHGIADKMVARHPHVFGAEQVDNAAAQTDRWEARKARERSARAHARGERPSLLDNIPLGMPGLTRALKLQRRAARIGFDWKELPPIRARIDEELAELDAARGDERAEELGDLLFTVVNYARRIDVDPEAAMRAANAKFERRFRHVEAHAGDDPAAAGLDRLEELWQEAKRLEREGS